MFAGSPVNVNICASHRSRLAFDPFPAGTVSGMTKVLHKETSRRTLKIKCDYVVGRIFAKQDGMHMIDGHSRRAAGGKLVWMEIQANKLAKNLAQFVT